MSAVFDLDLAIRAISGHSALAHLNRGIEKESLRVTPSGQIASTPHPVGLGSALKHPHITTDFAEAQLELITDVFDSAEGCLAELEDIHRYVYSELHDELLWATSMPCVLGDAESIPVGYYGTSNVGKSKTVYRLGLGHRYGRLMQTISGIHYNFSVPEALWPVLAGMRGQTPDQDFMTREYFGLIRNFRRHSWLLIYLLGASPAVCKSFIRSDDHGLETFDEGTLYLPYATSLRMGRLGYQSDAQSSLHISYNNLQRYASTMTDALTRPYPPYEKIGVKVDGAYRQLNTALLQIENEFYGTIRPKRRTQTAERPITALLERGVEYVEVRCLDLNPFLRVGIDAPASRFIDAFLVHCLISPSPDDSRAESEEIMANQLNTVRLGRHPEVTLSRGGESVPLSAWASTLLDEIEAVANAIDASNGADDYAFAVSTQRQKVKDPNLTPSARVLEAMRTQRIPFFRFAMNQSVSHKGYFEEHPLRPARKKQFERMRDESLRAQAQAEADESESFDAYLERFMTLEAT